MVVQLNCGGLYLGQCFLPDPGLEIASTQRRIVGVEKLVGIAFPVFRPAVEVEPGRHLLNRSADTYACPSERIRSV